MLPWLVWLSELSASLQTQGVTCLIPSQGTCLGCRPGPQWGHAGGNDALMFLSLSSSPLSKNKSFLKKLLIKEIKGALSEILTSGSKDVNTILNCSTGLMQFLSKSQQSFL